ncbi:LamG domain-containing protein, partial [Patescibacteria group bacterium]|nr:LamG domain-containing protein [Patescibacteria group bacterium]
SIPIRNWTEIALTFDSTLAELKIYLNGKLENKANNTLCISTLPAGKKFFVGWNNNSSHPKLEALYDGIIMLSIPRNSVEILADYTNRSR